MKYSSLKYQVVKIEKLENLSLWQRLNSIKRTHIDIEKLTRLMTLQSKLLTFGGIPSPLGFPTQVVERNCKPARSSIFLAFVFQFVKIFKSDLMERNK